MGYTETFMDNATYGASDLNGLIKKLSAQGISVEFENILNDGANYTPSDLNSLIQAIAADGVTKDSCKVIMSGGSAKVTEGTIVFGNGSTITVDSAGVVLPVTAGVKNYVYAISKPDLNHNYLKCETSAPTGDYVMLAEVENGVATDKRKFAASKFVAGYNMHEVFHIEKRYSLPGSTKDWMLTDTLPVHRSDYKKVLFRNNKYDLNSIENHGYVIDVIWDLETGTCAYGGYQNGKLTDRIKTFHVNYMDAFIKFVKDGMNIQIYSWANQSGGGYNADFTIEVC